MRVKLLRVDVQALLNFGALDIRNGKEVWPKEWPADLRFEGMAVSELDPGCLVIRVSSESFPEVDEGQALEYFTPIFVTRTHMCERLMNIL